MENDEIATRVGKCLSTIAGEFSYFFFRSVVFLYIHKKEEIQRTWYLYVVYVRFIYEIKYKYVFESSQMVLCVGCLFAAHCLVLTSDCRVASIAEMPVNIREMLVKLCVGIESLAILANQINSVMSLLYRNCVYDYISTSVAAVDFSFPFNIFNQAVICYNMYTPYDDFKKSFF